MALHIDAGEFKVVQQLDTATPASFGEVGRVVVLVSAGAATEHWYLYTSTDTTTNPGTAVYRAPGSANPTASFQLVPVVAAAPFDPAAFDPTRYGDDLRAAGLDHRYIRAACGEATAHDGRSALPEDVERGGDGTGSPRPDGQIYLNVAGTYYEVQQAGSRVGYLFVDGAPAGSTDAAIEDWRLYASYATPTARSGGAYTIAYKVGALPLGTPFNQVLASCSALPP